jgi:acetolactate synthase-1/2/3 large subunit
VQLARGVCSERAAGAVPLPSPTPDPPDTQRIKEIAALVASAHRPLLFVGAGAAGAADALAGLAERLGAPVVTTTSGRGCLSEDHPLSLGFELGGTRARPLNALLERADLVLALGCKFSHNGARGFALRIPPAKLVHVDASGEVLGVNYDPRIGLKADVAHFLEALVPHLASLPAGRTTWPVTEIEEARRHGLAESWARTPEPKFPGLGSRGAQGFFSDLRAALPDEGCLVTDSGLHQNLARRWFRVRAPRTFIVPTNLQSMGFALPAAVGARLARPDAPVIALLGDGGFRMSGLELACAVDLGLELTVIVFNDGAYGLIRRGQLSAFGKDHGTRLAPVDLQAVAAACGANYIRSGSDPGAALHAARGLGGVVLIEVPLREAAGFLVVRAKGTVRRWLGPPLRRRIRSLLGR